MFGTQQFSGTYNFSPSVPEIIINAFGRIRVHPTEILVTHLQQAVLELNLLVASRFSNTQPNLWTVDLQTLPLVQGQATYSLPAETVMITNAYMRTGTSTTSDRLLFPISQTEYASIPNKTSQASPNQFWYNRVISQTITFFPTPDGNGPYVVYYYRVRQVQDTLAAGATNIEVPVRFLDAVTAGLSHRLARIYAPPLEQIRKADSEDAWMLAATEDTERVDLHITPGLSGYFR